MASTPHPFIPSIEEAQSWCDFLIGVYKDPVPRLHITYVASRDTTGLTTMAALDLSYRITVDADGNVGLDIAEDFIIEAERHVIDSHLLHTVTYDLSPVSAFAGYWTLGVGSLGVSTRLVY